MADSQKSLLEIVLLPIVITGVGILSTQIVTKAQLASADRIAQANISSADQHARSDQQIKLLEMFSDQFKSDDPAKRRMAVQMLGALEPELAEKLATAIAQSDPDAQIRDVAQSVAQTASQSAGSAFVVVGSYPTLIAAQDAVKALKSKQVNLPYAPEIYLSENHFYAVTFGGHLSSNEANRRIQAARGIVPDAYIRISDRWSGNLSP